MGLFGKSKTVACAICGTEAKTGLFRGLFQKKVDGHFVCNDCYGVVDIPSSKSSSMTLEEFKTYRAFRAENQKLKSVFKATTQIAYDDKTLLFDVKNGFFSLSKNLSTTIFEAKQLLSFAITEDDHIIFQGNPDAIVMNKSNVPDKIKELAPQIKLYQMQMQLFQTALDTAPEEKKDELRQKKPTLNVDPPFSRFMLELHWDHPYWNNMYISFDAPGFDLDEPDANDYLKRYTQCYASMEKLAGAFIELSFSGAKITDNRAPKAEIPSKKSARDELKRYKELLDMGILTQEEFDIKKHELLEL